MACGGCGSGSLRKQQVQRQSDKKEVVQQKIVISERSITVPSMSPDIVSLVSRPSSLAIPKSRIRIRCFSKPESRNTLIDTPSTFNPSSHNHGAITNDGKIGTTADLPISTIAGGELAARSVADFRTMLGLGTASDVTFNGLTITPSSSRTLSTNGQFTIEMTSNTAGNLVYRGSDGTTRRAPRGFTTDDTTLLVNLSRVTEVTNTPTGTTQTITLNSGNHQTLDLGSATGAVTTTLTVPSSSAAGTIIVLQGATVRDITWVVSSGTIQWLGVEPDWATMGIGKTIVVAWRWNGSIMRLAASEEST